MASAAQLEHRAHGNTEALSWLSLMTVWFVWGSTFLGIRVAVAAIPPFLMAGTRYLVAGAILGTVLWLTLGRKRRPLTWADFKSIAIHAVLLLVLGNGLLSFAEVHLESGVAALIVASVPIWMLIIDAAYARRIHPFAVAGIVVGTLGIVLLVGAPSGHISILHALLVVAGSLSWAFGSVIARRSSSGHTNPLRSSLEMLIGGVVLCLVSLAAGEPARLHLAQLPTSSVLGWLWLVIMGSMVAYTAYGYAVRTLPTNVVATYAYVNPIVAVFLGALLLHEPLTLNVWLGGGAIVAAVVSIMLGNRAAS